MLGRTCTKILNTHFMFNNVFQIRAVEEIMWRIIVERNSLQMTVWYMLIACWILKSTNTHSEYVIRIAFPLQQYLHERAWLLRYRCIACLVDLFCNWVQLYLLPISFEWFSLLVISVFLLWFCNWPLCY
jgi:hypothetical protein